MSASTTWMLCIHTVDASSGDNWLSPESAAIKRVSDLPGDTFDGHVFDNIDCAKITYRLPDRQNMSMGCFSNSSIGFIQEGGARAIFNGTDEALPLIPYESNQLLSPWPGGEGVLSLSQVVTGGMRLGMYTNLLGVLHDNRFLGELVSKRITEAATPITDPAGQPIDINPQTLAFSSSGEWLVAETLSGSFVRINHDEEVLPFAPSYNLVNNDRLFPSYLSISNDGRYVAIYNQNKPEFRVYDLDSCSTVLDTGVKLPPKQCASFDYLPLVKSAVAETAVIRHVRFINDDLMAFQVVTSTEVGKIGVYEMTPSDKIGPLIEYLAMGDSYTSGEGAFDYLDRTDTKSNKCHLSLWSYPLLIAGGTAHSVACSGARINDVASQFKGYRGQALDSVPPNTVLASFMPGYIPQHKFVNHYQPSVTSISVGGNDIGFADMIERCVTPRISPSTCYDTYEDRLEVKRRIEGVKPRLISLYKQLQTEAPSTALYVIGYPQVANKDGDCGLNVRLNRSELAFAEQVISYFNSVIEQAAYQSGARYIDISQALNGHRLCDGSDIAVNGLTAGNDMVPFGRESYHPNSLGYHLISQVIQAKIQIFNDLVQPPQADDTQLLDAPHTGRPIRDTATVNDMVYRSVQPGSYTPVNLSGEDTGLKPHTPYSIMLDNSLLDTTYTDADSRISAAIFIPVNTQTGAHLLDIVGEDEGGNTADVSQLFYIADPGEINISQSLSLKIESLSVSG